MDDAENYGKVKVCKYGSDPLKTYLPNSDIDITLIPVLLLQPPPPQQKGQENTEAQDQADTQSNHQAAAASTTTAALSSLNFYHELDSITKMLNILSEMQQTELSENPSVNLFRLPVRLLYCDACSPFRVRWPSEASRWL